MLARAVTKIAMNVFDDNKDEECNGDGLVEPDNKDTQVQLVISLSLGVTAFLLFCVSSMPWIKLLILC